MQNQIYYCTIVSDNYTCQRFNSVEKYQKSISQLIGNWSLLCVALNTTDEKAGNLLVT